MIFPVTLLMLLYSLVLQQVKWVTAVASSGPLQLVGDDGLCRSSNVVGKYIGSSSVSDKGTVSVVNLIDCTAQTNTDLANKVYGVDFAFGHAGIALQTTGNTAVLYGSFKSMISRQFCGGKAIDYGCSMPGSVCIAISGYDLDSYLQGYSQVFRRLLWQIYHNFGSSSTKTRVSLLVDKTGCEKDESISDKEYEAKVTTFLRMLWSELSPEGSLEDALDLKLVSVDLSNEASIESAKSEISDASTSEYSPEELAAKLTTTWESIPTVIKPVLSPRQREAVYQIESAYTFGIAQADIAISQWQARVVRGRTVGNFAQRVRDLLSSATKDFNRKVQAGFITQLAVRERGERFSALRNHILTAAERLFAQQVAVLVLMVTEDFRKALVKLIAREDLSDELRKEQEQQALRKSIFDFKSYAKDLEDISLGMTVDDEQVTALSSQLSELLAEFPESSIARLEEVRKVERQARKKSKTSRRKSRTKPKGILKMLGVSLNLVGFLRPPGFGNLQGFIGYATGLFGIPCDLLLGVQNDGDSPEIMGDDREHPILRLQPKINFDIDL